MILCDICGTPIFDKERGSIAAIDQQIKDILRHMHFDHPKKHLCDWCLGTMARGLSEAAKTRVVEVRKDVKQLWSPTYNKWVDVKERDAK